MDITQVSIIHHAALVLLMLWIFSSLGCTHPFLYFGSVFYLYKVNVHYSIKLRRRLQFEESKYANQRRLLSDSESVRWLNHAIEKIWPICMEQIASQQFLLPIIPWFLDKYKPWIALKAVVQHLYLGRSPPMFTEIRVLGESADDDHLVLELGMSFLSADDMNGIFEVQLRKRLGLGIRANLHVTGMHVEGKVLVGVKFLRHWPFLGRMRVCFVEPPYFQMTVKPIFNHGVDVTELPGIAGWVDNILAAAFEQTLVEPNMLVVDVEKFVSAPKENWFTVDEKQPIAFVILEIVEAADLKSSDMNGLSDPYVKGQLGPIRFRTKIQKKTLAPKWLQEFKIPICSWEAPNVLLIEVRDKDTIFDDTLGDCSIKINNLRGGQRHDKWFTLQNIKKGRLHLAITVLEDEHEKKSDSERGHLRDDKEPSTSPSPGSVTRSCSDADVSFHEGRNMADEFEPINIEGQLKTGIWVHHPGSEVCQTWEPRKGRDRRLESRLQKDIDSVDSPRSAASGSLRSNTNDNDEQADGSSHRRRGTVRKGLHKIGAIFHRSPKNDGSTHHGKQAIRVPRPNLRAVGDKGISVKLVVDEGCAESLSDRKAGPDRPWIETAYEESPGTDHVRGVTNKNEDYSALKFTSVLSRKDSDKLKEDQVSGVAAREASRRADSSNQDSKDYPPTVGEVPVDVASLSDLDRGLANAEDAKEPT